MGEAYLDWQKKTSGIKLNDVIEEYRYVAKGKSVKKGDFLTYVGEDVAPATEPPFNAIALSSGIGGTDTEHNEQVKIARVYKEVEVTKTGDIVPKTWTKISDTEYVAEDGTRLISSSYRSPSSTFNYEASLGCDGDTDTSWLHNLDDFTPSFTLSFPTAIKILKMNVRITFGYIENLEKCQIVGSNDGVVWKTLYDIEEQIYPITEIVLSNPDFYKMYRVEASYSEILNMAVCELQTSEYITKEVIQ